MASYNRVASCARCQLRQEKQWREDLAFSLCTHREGKEQPLLLAHSLHAEMKHLTAEAKHAILLEYTPHTHTHSFAALARRHSIKGGRRVLQRWHERWNGTPQSLKEESRSGRPRRLSRGDVQRDVAGPILRANRSHTSVHYSAVVTEVREKTGAEIPLRTVQRYGKEELGVRQRRGKKRTAEERQYTDASEGRCRIMMRVWRVDSLLPSSCAFSLFSTLR